MWVSVHTQTCITYIYQKAHLKVQLLCRRGDRWLSPHPRLDKHHCIGMLKNDDAKVKEEQELDQSSAQEVCYQGHKLPNSFEMKFPKVIKD